MSIVDRDITSPKDWPTFPVEIVKGCPDSVEILTCYFKAWAQMGEELLERYLIDCLEDLTDNDLYTILCGTYKLINEKRGGNFSDPDSSDEYEFWWYEKDVMDMYMKRYIDVDGFPREELCQLAMESFYDIFRFYHISFTIMLHSSQNSQDNTRCGFQITALDKGEFGIQ